jgi:hypothetical protein
MYEQDDLTEELRELSEKYGGYLAEFVLFSHYLSEYMYNHVLGGDVKSELA